jgi:hypothetical protein
MNISSVQFIIFFMPTVDRRNNARAILRSENLFSAFSEASRKKHPLVASTSAEYMQKVRQRSKVT